MPLRLLLVEDSEDDAMLLALELRNGGVDFDFTRVDTPQELEAALGGNTWDAVIVDYNMPAFTGLDALRLFQAKGIDIPFILVSGAIGEEQAVEAMKAGFHDFVMKGNYFRLVQVLERELRETTVRRERGEAVEALRRAHADLEQRVAERTAEIQAANRTLRASQVAALNLMEDAVIARRQAEETSEKLRLEIAERQRAEEELRLAKEAAEAATRAKSRFLANMSHELRTPMNGVLGMLEHALNGPLEEEQREFIDTARKSAGSLLRILNDILDLNKVEAGKFSIEEKPFDLRECVAGAVDILIPEARRKSIRLLQAIAAEAPETVVGDHVRLAQVLTNLIGNAVKFTEHGKVEVMVDAGGCSADGRREFVFTVTDTGIGIPADRKGLLFRPFSQVDDSNTRKYGGTGLGLAICREIVEKMGGAISVESKEGTGSKFTFTVFLGESKAGGIAVTEPARPAEPAPRGHDGGKGPRLLVAEDDPVGCQVLRVLFKRQNMEPDFATDGLQAVEKWEKGEYDLILMDVQMPRMDGFEATRVIRGKEKVKGSRTPIVAMTAHAFAEDEQRCLDAGMDAYIAKPVDFKKCMETIGKVLGSG